MGSSLLARCIGVMAFPRKTFLELAENHNEWDVRILSLSFGFLIAKQIMHPDNHDLFVYLITSLSAGIGFVYFSGYLMSWLVKLSGNFVYPAKMRMVLAYAFTPYILALLLLLLTEIVDLPKGVSAIAFILVVWSWVLAVFGVKTVGDIKRVQAIFVVMIPIAALILVISILFKVVWMIGGYGA